MNEPGIRLHAASGPVSLQSHNGATRAAAERNVTCASTQATLTAAAAIHLLAEPEKSQGWRYRIWVTFPEGNEEVVAIGAHRVPRAQEGYLKVSVLRRHVANDLMQR